MGPADLLLCAAALEQKDYKVSTQLYKCKSWSKQLLLRAGCTFPFRSLASLHTSGECRHAVQLIESLWVASKSECDSLMFI